jgi:signal transduction histidine kinase
MLNNERFWDRVISPEHYINNDDLRRSRILLIVSFVVFIIGNFRGLFYLVNDKHESGIWLIFTAFLSLMVFYGARKGWPLIITCNLMISIMFVACCFTAWSRGGVGSIVLTGLGIATLLATFLRGWKTGMVWMFLSLGTIGVTAVLQNQGRVVSEHFKGPQTMFVDLTATVVIVGILFAIGGAYDWSRKMALYEFKLSEESRKKAEENIRLLKADRIASMGVMAAGIGHEINNPLTYILINLQELYDLLPELINTEDPKIELAQELVSESLDGTNRIRTIVAELKKFSRIDAVKGEESFSIALPLQAAIVLVRSTIKSTITVETNFCATGNILGDETRLMQVFVNLLLNAAYSMGSYPESGQSIWVSLHQDEHTFVIQFKDSGPGIPPEVIEKIFEPFFTTRPKGEGTGLGLSVSLGIIEEMGGTLTVKSSLGEGATFIIRIPIDNERELIKD